eukprot:gene25002-30487_t
MSVHPGGSNAAEHSAVPRDHHYMEETPVVPSDTTGRLCYRY